MAGYEGISKVNGVAIGNIAKIGGRAKADVFNISSTPRQSNLYKTLTKNTIKYHVLYDYIRKNTILFEYSGGNINKIDQPNQIIKINQLIENK